MASYLIIGASSGIGKEIVSQLRSENHKIWATSRKEGLDGLIVLDPKDPASFATIEEPLDGLVYCPGSITLKPLKSLREEDFKEDFETNLLGAFRILKHYLPNLQANGGSVVLFSTVAAQLGLPFHASIASAKGAIEGMTRSLAAELAPKIRVNAIAPSLTDTSLASKLLDTESKRKAAEDRHPLKRIGQASDIASLAVWLLSAKSQFVSGQVIAIDGGLGSIKPN